MNHLGDITKIRGCAIPAVDCDGRESAARRWIYTRRR